MEEQAEGPSGAQGTRGLPPPTVAGASLRGPELYGPHVPGLGCPSPGPALPPTLRCLAWPPLSWAAGQVGGSHNRGWRQRGRWDRGPGAPVAGLPGGGWSARAAAGGGGGGAAMGSRAPHALVDTTPAKTIVVYRNGDQFYVGRKFVLSRRRVATFEALLEQLTEQVEVPFGVRRLFTPTRGRPVLELDSLQAGGKYVAAGRERFKKLE